MESMSSMLLSSSASFISYPKPFSFPLISRPRRYAIPRASAGEVLDKPIESVSSKPTADFLPKIDKSGRFCSPRAARELAMSIIYTACLEGSDPVRLFERRMNSPREPSYEFDRTALTAYNQMSFAGPPVNTDTVEEAGALIREDEKESAIEAEVLSAPPKLVYSKLILRLARKLLVAVVERWNSHVLVIDKVVPSMWKALGFSGKLGGDTLWLINFLFRIVVVEQSEPASRILELSILHLAMSEIAVLGTKHPIVINEAVDLAKRFCDGSAPRVINGCLRTFIKDLEDSGAMQQNKMKQKIFNSS